MVSIFEIKVLISHSNGSKTESSLKKTQAVLTLTVIVVVLVNKILRSQSFPRTRSDMIFEWVLKFDGFGPLRHIYQPTGAESPTQRPYGRSLSSLVEEKSVRTG